MGSPDLGTRRGGHTAVLEIEPARSGRRGDDGGGGTTEQAMSGSAACFFSSESFFKKRTCINMIAKYTNTSTDTGTF
jgi:hypothetical protein